MIHLKRRETSINILNPLIIIIVIIFFLERCKCDDDDVDPINIMFSFESYLFFVKRGQFFIISRECSFFIMRKIPSFFFLLLFVFFLHSTHAHTSHFSVLLSNIIHHRFSSSGSYCQFSVHIQELWTIRVFANRFRRYHNTGLVQNLKIYFTVYFIWLYSTFGNRHHV